MIKQVQRRLVRRAEIADFDDWAHSRQAWLVQTVVRHTDGRDEVMMERWYLTNLPWNTLSARQILTVVRGHWSIENDCNWGLDVAWEEDTTAWSTNAAEVVTHQPLRTLSWLRMLAYNVLGWLLRVRLRSQPTWLELRDALRGIHDRLGITSIFVTHDQEEALEVADRVVVINQGKIEQSGSPQQVWEHPASPFVYGFLGDVNLFHGRAHEGLVHLEGMQIDSPEHQAAQNAKAFAYVRPHDLDVERYSPGAGLDAEGRPRGIVAQLSRAIVVGPIARLELIPTDDHKPADNASPESLIEAQIPAQQFKEMGFKEGETLVVTPRRARVFLDHAAGI